MSRIQKLSQILDLPCLIEETADLLYFTGLTVSRGRLYVSKDAACLYVDGRYYEKAKREAPCPVKLWDEQKQIPDPRMGFDSATVTYQAFLALKSEFPQTEWIPIPNPAKKIRLIKEPEEVKALKRAADLTWRGYQKVISLLKEGVSEEELALEFEIFCRRNGASGLSFEPIIAFGENSAYPHYRAGKTRLKEGHIVLVDVGAVVDHYHGDMTRIFYFGKPDPRLVRLEEIVRGAKKMALAHVKPGVRICDLDQMVRNEFEKEDVKQLYTHSLGHGIGLETHEFPIIRCRGEDSELPLEPGMVITIEPGLYQPGVGGIRLEDTVHVTETGYENFFAQQ